VSHTHVITIESPLYLIYLPSVMKNYALTPTPMPDLRITALSGTTTPEYVTIQNVDTGSQDMNGVVSGQHGWAADVQFPRWIYFGTKRNCTH